MSAAPLLDEDRPYLFGRRRTWLIMFGVVTGAFVIAVNQAMLIVSVPQMVGDLGGIDSFAWIFTIYFLASTVTIPIWGKLADRYGRRPLLTLALVSFLVGSVICAVAPTLAVLLVGRACQGVGAGGIAPITLAVTADIMAPRERGKWMSFQLSAFLFAQLAGPAIGGAITDTAGWRWAFLISIPFAAVSLAITLVAIRIPHHAIRRQLDYLGATLLTGALVSGLLAASLGGRQYAWGSATIVGLFAASAALAVVFVWWERRVPDPIIPTELYRSRTFVAGQIIVFVVGSCMWAVNTYLPLLAQGALHYSATGSGAILMPFGLSIFVFGSLLGQVMSRTGAFRWQLFLSPVLMFAGFYLLLHMNAIPGRGEIIGGLVIAGAGVALGNSITIVVQNAMPQRMVGVVSAGNQFARVIGGTILITVLGAVMAANVKDEIARRLPVGSALRDVDPDQLIAHRVAIHGAERTIVEQALGRAIPSVFAVLLPLLVIALLAAFLVDRRPLRETVGDGEQAAPEPAAATAA
jgi:EmrB/QacA subfamily drug resistance transporter